MSRRFMKAHSRSLLAALLASLAVVPALAQDPTQTLPDSYHVQFENDYVRIVKVHYAAGAKLASHTHPAGQTAYIYLNDSEGVIFRHTGRMNRVTNRPPVKMGAVRFSTGMGEDHEVENTSAVPSDFLRIMIKTENPGGGGRRLQPTDMQYENKQLRMTRLRVEQHDTATITAKEPALIIELPSGATRWLAAGQAATIDNHEQPVLSLMRFDFLTKPK
jgi:hypothetical protein